MLEIETKLWGEINSDYLYYIMFCQSFSIMSEVKVLERFMTWRMMLLHLQGSEDKNSYFRLANIQQSLACWQDLFEGFIWEELKYPGVSPASLLDT